jgi:ketosteroid isomerase-like protein
MTRENENVEIIRGLYEAFNRGGDWSAVLLYLSPEIEFETDPRHPKAGIYRGLEQYQAFLEEFEAPYEQTVMEPEQFFAKDDQVVAFVKARRRPRDSTAEIEIRVGFLWTLRDGKIVREQVFAEREKALEAAGLPQTESLTGR